MRIAAVAACAGLVLAGCAGGSASSTYSCPYPDAVACESLSSVYDRTAGRPAELAAQPPFVRVPAPSSWPAVRQPRVLKVWLAPWQDEDGDLHGKQQIYMLIGDTVWSERGLQRQRRLGRPQQFAEPGP